jgi:hypothetical protein
MPWGYTAPHLRSSAMPAGKNFVPTFSIIILTLKLCYAFLPAQMNYLDTCDSPLELERRFRLSVPIYLTRNPSANQLSKLPSCLDINSCELLASPVDDCRDGGEPRYQECQNVVSCSNGSVILHPELYAEVMQSDCSPYPSNGTTVRTCDDVVVQEEVWKATASGNCTNVCRPKLGSAQVSTDTGMCKFMVMELRTSSLLTALKLSAALKSPSSLGLLERCLGGGPQANIVQAAGPAGRNF